MDETLVTYSGGTRCGAVRFTVTVDKHEASQMQLLYL